MQDPIRITGIEEWRGGFRLHISSLEEPIECSGLLIAQHRLKEGIVLTPPQVEQIKRQAELEACDREVARLLSLRDHSEGEVRAKLARKRFSRETIGQILKAYRERRLLDDAQFAQAHARRLLERKPAGRSYLVAYLRRKYIDRDLAERTVDTLLSDRDETGLARASLQQRWSHWSQFDLETARRKAYTYLSRRGIGYEAARAAFEELYNTEHEDSDH
jgi:regulatory protein